MKNHNHRSFLVAALGVALAAPAATAQSFNIDIGTHTGPPSSSYGGAADSPGVWNEIDMSLPIQTPIPLVDLAGNPTNATVEFNSQGSGNYTYNNPGTTGDDEALLDDLCDTGSTGTNVRFVFQNLDQGMYQVYSYAWAPDNRAFFKTNVELLSGTLGVQSSGAVTWPGDHALGGTYVIDTYFVSAITLGRLRIDFWTGAGFGSANGIQLVGPLACAGTAESYCTAGTSASGCQALLAVSGSASASAASDFVLSAAGVEGAKDGLVFFGSNGRQANPWGNGTSYQCVVPPVKRAGVLAGNGTNGACDGSFSQDLNSLWCPSCPKPNKNPGAGALVQAQIWYRDPASTSNQTTSLSNAVEFSVCPR